LRYRATLETSLKRYCCKIVRLQMWRVTT